MGNKEMEERIGERNWWERENSLYILNVFNYVFLTTHWYVIHLRFPSKKSNHFTGVIPSSTLMSQMRSCGLDYHVALITYVSG